MIFVLWLVLIGISQPVIEIGSLEKYKIIRPEDKLLFISLSSRITLFSEAGYNKDKASYLKLIQENEDALSDSFSLFKEAGYKNDINNFKNLMGFEVEDEVEVSDDELETSDGV